MNNSIIIHKEGGRKIKQKIKHHQVCAYVAHFNSYSMSISISTSTTSERVGERTTIQTLTCMCIRNLFHFM
jgi:hypothetical protein